MKLLESSVLPDLPWGVYLALVVFGFFMFIKFLFKCAIIVRQSHIVLVEHFGKFSRSLKPGLHFLIPIVQDPVTWTNLVEGPRGERIAKLQGITQIPLLERVYDVAPINVVLKDNKRAEVNAVFTYRITDPVAAVYNIQDLPLALEMLVQARLHFTCADLKFDEITRDRRIVQTKILQHFATTDLESLGAWGVKISSFELQEIGLAKDIRDAYEERQRAEMKRGAELERAKSEHERMLAKEEADAKAATIKANAEYERNVLKAKADVKQKEYEAQAREIEAKSNAAARLVSQRSEAEGYKLMMNAGFNAEEIIDLRRVAGFSDLAKANGTKAVVVPYESSAIVGGRVLDRTGWDFPGTRESDDVALPVIEQLEGGERRRRGRGQKK